MSLFVAIYLCVSFCVLCMTLSASSLSPAADSVGVAPQDRHLPGTEDLRRHVRTDEMVRARC